MRLRSPGHFDPRVAGTLPRIPDLGRRLLALRSYLRAGPTLPERWSWSEREICEFERTPEFRDAQAELDRVTAAFATAFPGYTLYVNREVRSLDVQIERWNENASVDAAAQALLTELRQASAHRQSGTSADWLRNALAGWTPRRARHARCPRSVRARPVTSLSTSRWSAMASSSPAPTPSTLPATGTRPAGRSD
jgi:hypothetical protein